MRLGTAAISSATGAIRGSATIMADDKVVLSLRNGEFSPLESGDADKIGPMPAAHLHWKPHVDFISPNNLISSVQQGMDVDEVANIEKLALLCQLSMLQHNERTQIRRVVRVSTGGSLNDKQKLLGAGVRVCQTARISLNSTQRRLKQKLNIPSNFFCKLVVPGLVLLYISLR